MEKRLPTTREMRVRLEQMLGDANLLLVSRWLNSPREDTEEIGETVGLMAQVAAALLGQIDVFIGSVDTAAAGVEKPTPQVASSQVETELVDLLTDEPIASLLNIEAPLHLAQSFA
jgi:hypothetical protein